MEKLASPENIKPIQRLFIAQRGESAIGALQACEKRLQRGEKIEVVVPYTFSELNSIASQMVAKHTDDGWKLTPMAGTRQEQNFANPDRLLMAALASPDSSGCDTIYLGHGFLSEDKDFIKRCEEAGIRVLAPPSAVMEVTGNKIRARQIAKQTKIGRIATIPIVEGTDDLKNFEEAVKAADRLAYPVMLKDPDLGGGKGNRVAKNKQELEDEWKILKGKPENKQLFLERYIEHAVHVEIQIIADKYGNVVALGERDCSTQRDDQKIIEESPSPRISDRLRGVLQTAAVNFAKNIGYQGVGTWEFLVDLDRKGRGGDRAWYFMEVNPRIQVEHRVTEEVTGIDIVETMMDIAEGKPLPFTQEQIIPQGHAIELRIYAEDPLRKFAPSPGKIDVFRYPEKEGVRVAPSVAEGDSLSPWYDRTLMLAVAKGTTREEARRKLVEFALELEISGVSSNLSFGLELLNSEAFRDGRMTTRYAEEYWRERTKQKIHSGGIINGGSVSKQEPSLRFNPEAMLQNTTIIPDRIDGEKNEQRQTISYSKYLEKTKQRTGKDCAAEYYIVAREGVRFVIYDLDYNVLGGTLGVQEGNVFEDACKLANKEHLPLVTISRSGGARQWENSLALFQMGRTIAALEEFPPSLFINIYAGPVYGGVPASFAGVADVEMAVDSPDTHIGFSGPYIVAKNSGKKPASFGADDAYKVLPEGTHTAIKQYEDRNVHILISNLEEAGGTISHLIHINRRGLREAITDPNFRFIPRQELIHREVYGRVLRLDRPDRRFTAWMRSFGSFLERHRPSRSIREVSLEPLTVAQKMEILNRGDRPTAADLLDPRLGLVDDSTFLTSPPFEFPEIQQYPSIIAACANIGDLDLFVLGQQTQRVYDPEKKIWMKKYEGQKPEDWEYVLHMLNVAHKLRLPVLLLGDTNGADPSPQSESRNQSHKIAKVIQEINRYPYPVLSGLIGLKGSGGGETFIRPLDFAFDTENALSFVATPEVQYWIIANKWIDGTSTDEEKAELAWYINQLRDATAQGRLELKMIDTIIKEGAGGAHLHLQFFAREMRREITQVLPSLLRLSQRELLERRWNRITVVNSLVSTPFTS